jgi:hypothetical protein
MEQHDSSDVLALVERVRAAKAAADHAAAELQKARDVVWAKEILRDSTEKEFRDARDRLLKAITGETFGESMTTVFIENTSKVFSGVHPQLKRSFTDAVGGSGCKVSTEVNK